MVKWNWKWQSNNDLRWHVSESSVYGKMANVRDSDTSLWLHNKLGTSNDSWISGSICTQLNKEVLRNIKECFADLQTQVKLKLLLSLFHIPRRLVEEVIITINQTTTTTTTTTKETTTHLHKTHNAYLLSLAWKLIIIWCIRRWTLFQQLIDK